MNCLVTRRYGLSLLHNIPTDCSPNSASVHGHDFKLEVTLKAPIDRVTGWAVHRDILDGVVEEKIRKPFNRTLVNEKLRFATGEDMALTFMQILRQSDIGDMVAAVQLTETRKNRYQGLAVNSVERT